MEKYTVLSNQEMRNVKGGFFEAVGNITGRASYWLSKGWVNIAEGNHTAKINANKRK